VTEEHLTGDLDVDRVDVVEQAGSEEAADLEDKPGGDEDRDGLGVPAARGELGVRCQLSVLSFVERAVGVEDFAGALFEEEFVVAEKLVDFVALFDGDEENFARAFAPGVREVLCAKEDGRDVGEGAAEEHRSGAAFDEIDFAAQVEGNGGTVSLVAIEENFVVRRDGMVGLEVLDGFGERF
jgi:hypothetical protein